MEEGHRMFTSSMSGYRGGIKLWKEHRAEFRRSTDFETKTEL
jgi:hypothetical protein